MKKEIHPNYGKTTVTCSCGNTFESQSTVPEINIDICSVCHPFYTGKQKLVDTAGRVDKFRSRLLKMEEMKSNSPTKAKKTKNPTLKPDRIVNIKEIKEELKDETVNLTKK